MPHLHNVSVTFLDEKKQKNVLENVTLDIPDGKITAIMGPSGCGKTTLLRLLAGLISPTLGNVTRETEHISFLFQDTALLPWLTAAENVNLVLSDGAPTYPKALEWLSRVDLADEADTYPSALSGGMRQRVGLARALCTDADLLLLDEPFRGLDDDLRERMLDLISEVRKGKTTLIVTHDKRDLRIADALVEFPLAAEKADA